MWVSNAYVSSTVADERRAELRVVEHADSVDSVDDNELVLTTGRVLQHFDSGALSRRSGILVRLRSEDVRQIHLDDAAARGIEDGDEVGVSNDRGTVFATFHYVDPLVNVLTGDTLDPVANIPEYKHSTVSVEAAGESDDRADESEAAAGTD